MVHRTPFFLPWLYPTLTWRVADAPKTIFLTFDDGPVIGPTEFVVDTLASANVRATFFCIGDNIRKHRGVFDSLVAAGHAIGNHTFNHLNGWKTSTKDYVDNVQACTEIIGAPGVGNGQPLFRPPYGRISRAQIELLAPAFEVVMWDVLSMDYRKTLSPDRCLHNTVRAVRNGSIVVFHDSLKAEKNLRYVLPKFIGHFKSLGHRFDVIPSR